MLRVLPLMRSSAVTLPVYVVFAGFLAHTAHGQEPNPVSVLLSQNQYNLKADGSRFLLDEAQRASFFLLGELHGENEIPAMIRDLWPSLWKTGYRHVAAELSPWAAGMLEFA
jgi:hypothetical protein